MLAHINSDQFSSMYPTTSFSTQRVCITMSFPPGCIRDCTEGPISSCILAITPSDSACSLFLMGSSMMNSSAPKPVIPPLRPAARQRPPSEVSHNATPCTLSLGSTLNTSVLYSLNLSLLRRLKLSAKVPSYPQIMTLLLGYLPRYQAGKVSVTVKLLP